MEQLYHLIKPYKCPVCNQDMLFFTTKDGNLIDYKKFIHRADSLENMEDYIGRRNVKFIKCINCNRSFIIDWTNGWPIPLTDRNKLKEFGI